MYYSKKNNELKVLQLVFATDINNDMIAAILQTNLQQFNILSIDVHSVLR